MALEPLNMQKIVNEGNTSNSSLVPVVERNSFPCLVKVNSSASKLNSNAHIMLS